MILLVRSRRRWTTRSEVFSVTSSSKWRSGTRRDVLPSSNWHHIAIHAIVDNIVTVTNVAVKQIQKDNVHHFHNRKNIERLEKADLTESDEDDDDDEDELEVIESGAKKLLDYFIGNKCYLFADINLTSIYIFFASRSLLLTSIAIPSV